MDSEYDPIFISQSDWPAIKVIYFSLTGLTPNGTTWILFDTEAFYRACEEKQPDWCATWHDIAYYTYVLFDLLWAQDIFNL